MTEKVTFTGASGDRLDARLDMPDGPCSGMALFAHCFTCNKDIFAASRIAKGLSDRGIGILRFDFTGLGSSEGEFANTNFSSNVQDLVAAAGYLKEIGRPADLLIGHSLGGAAVLAAAEQIPEAKAVATIGAPFDPEHVSHLVEGQREEIESQGQAEVTLAGRKFTIKKQFLEDIASQNQRDRIAKLGKALLVFHAPLDDTVGIENATGIFVAAKHPKSFVSLDSADHLLTKREDAEYVASVLAAWGSRYLPEEADAPATDGSVVVTETGKGKFQNSVSVGVHQFLADEPMSFGGLDTGPSPYDLLLAGLGACTNMTLRMYADLKKLPMSGVRTVLSHEKIHARDCEHCETTDGKLDKISRTLTIEGDLTAEQRAKLLEIADKCPVHRTLHSEVLIETSVTAN